MPLPDECITIGTFHQGDTSIFPQISAGKQCVPNSVIAVILHTEKPISNWTSMDLDDILLNGNSLYLNIYTRHDYLLVNEIPDIISFHQQNYKLMKHQPIAGSLQGTTSEISTNLIDALKSLEKMSLCAILSIGDSAGAYAMAVFSYNQKMYVFDSHSRNLQGLPHEKGKSIVVAFNTSEQASRYLEFLSNRLNCSQYELTPVYVYNIDLQKTTERQIIEEVKKKRHLIHSKPLECVPAKKQSVFGGTTKKCDLGISLNSVRNQLKYFQTG